MKTNLFRKIVQTHGRASLLLQLATAACLLAFTGCEKDDGDDDGGTVETPFAAPTGLTTVTDAANKSATFSWQPVSDADSYELNIVDDDTYTAPDASITIPGFDYDTDYIWKVRAKKNDVYSDWSPTATFRLDSDAPDPGPPSFLQKFIGRWGAPDAEITFRAKDYRAAYDSVLNHLPHTVGPVAVIVAKDNTGDNLLRVVSVSGMDAHITGGVAQSDFGIDSQLVNLQLTVDEQAGEIAAHPPFMSAHNVCKLSPNVKIGDIPNYQALLGEFADIVADKHINDIDFTVKRVHLIGTLDGDGNPVFHFTYDMQITRITHDLEEWQVDLAKLAGLDTDKLHELIPSPQYLTSEVAASGR